MRFATLSETKIPYVNLVSLYHVGIGHWPVLAPPFVNSWIRHAVVGGGGGHWAMASPSGALCDRSAPSNRECIYRGNLIGGRDGKSLLRNVPPCVYSYKENVVGECPPKTKRPSEKSLQ